MDHTTKFGLQILGVAFVIGALADGLLRATPWGLNIFLWMTIFVSLFFWLLRSHQEGENKRKYWLALPLILFSAAMVWRDSPTLKGLNLLMILVTLSLAVLQTQLGQVRLASVSQYVLGIFLSGLFSIGNPIVLVFSDIQWRDIPRAGWTRNLLAVARGLILAIPLLLIFGGLFMAADAVFESFIYKVFQINVDLITLHAFLILCFAWLAAGYLRGALQENEQASLGQLPSAASKIGIIEIGMVLGLLDLLFLSFVIIQIRYLFGGVSTVATTDLTYAEYARRGFFELVTVTTLALPVLLFAHWLLNKENPRHERIFRLLAGTQILLLFVVMASALQRMRMYQSEYGQTELRFYTTAFMYWLALVFVWFGTTVLRGNRQPFAFGALTSSFLMVALLNVINPDALIVRANLTHAQACHTFDAYYATSLSADAVPDLVQALPMLPQSERGMLSQKILERWSPPQHSDWRTWSLARTQAWQTVHQNAARLCQAGCPQHEPIPDGVQKVQ